MNQVPLWFGFYYLDYWNNMLVAFFGMAFLLLIELATPPPQSPTPNKKNFYYCSFPPIFKPCQQINNN